MMAPGQVEQAALFYKECTRCGGLVFNRSDQTTPRGGGLAHNHAVATKCAQRSLVLRPAHSHSSGGSTLPLCHRIFAPGSQ
jgi:hypothetical protein